MERKINVLKDIVIPTVTLLIICVVVTAALAATNWLTQKQMAEKEFEKKKESLEKVIAAGDYKEQEIEHDGQKIKYYEAIDGELKGYIFETSASGYGGAVSVMTGIQPDGKIAAVVILDASKETKGIGDRITNPAYLEQYKGQSGQVDEGANTITGATFSSKAVIKAVNSALELFDKVKG
ncbi:MAG TPA: FMN-binding protein [Clostridiales bacterium]|nr:FMN-binding protein [Clostridiales bacterium]